MKKLLGILWCFFNDVCVKHADRPRLKTRYGGCGHCSTEKWERYEDRQAKFISWAKGE
jgi:hypothetical protein